MSCSVCQGYDSDKCPHCSEGVRFDICPDCNGTGRAPYTAYNEDTDESKIVTMAEWYALPSDSEHGWHRFDEGGHYCSTCHGDGKIPEDY